MRSIHHVVDTSHPDFIVIRQTRIIDGHDLSGEVVFSRQNAAWVRQAVLAVSQHGPRQQAKLGDDMLYVYPGGHDSNPIVNLDNERGGETRAGIYGLSFDRQGVAQLLGELDGL
jgi:hypothetical protein